jgi:MULE transposase domain
MPLLNICAVTGGKKTIQVALCFLSGEKEESYRWAMQALKELMTKYGILAPITIVTDRELALLNCLDDSFPDSIHILCI